MHVKNQNLVLNRYSELRSNKPRNLEHAKMKFSTIPGDDKNNNSYNSVTKQYACNYISNPIKKIGIKKILCLCMIIQFKANIVSKKCKWVVLYPMFALSSTNEGKIEEIKA